jgi:hypothetical protein
VEIGTYASLLNRKIIIPLPTQKSIEVDRHFLFICLRPFVEKVRLDEKWYLKTYPDVQTAIASRVVSSASEHYSHYGFFEHRMPYRVQVDESWYVAQYPDVREAIAKKHFASGQTHFDTEGFREGRMPYPNFRLETIT